MRINRIKVYFVCKSGLLRQSKIIVKNVKSARIEIKTDKKRDKIPGDEVLEGKIMVSRFVGRFSARLARSARRFAIQMARADQRGGKRTDAEPFAG